jgi:hypothetical protein
MFSPIKSIGSQIGLPFLSQDEDSRLNFKSGKDGIKRLASKEVSGQVCEGYCEERTLEEHEMEEGGLLAHT